MRDRAHAARQKREADAATVAAWADWNHAEARARAMQIDVTGLTPDEEAGWRVIGKATSALLLLIAAELDAPYEDARALDADSAGYGYRAGGPDGGDRGIVVAELSEEVF